VTINLAQRSAPGAFSGRAAHDDGRLLFEVLAAETSAFEQVMAKLDAKHSRKTALSFEPCENLVAASFGFG